MLDRELKKGSAELMILSIVSRGPRHRVADQQADRDPIAGPAEVHIASPTRSSIGWRSADGCRADGSNAQGSADAVSTGSPGKAARVLARQRDTWRRSCWPWALSRESTMRDPGGASVDHRPAISARHAPTGVQPAKRDRRSALSISTSAIRSCGMPAPAKQRRAALLSEGADVTLTPSLTT